MIERIHKNLSLFTFLLLAFALIVGRFLLPRFETHDFLAILSWDVFGYYLYLPAKFIHHDLGISHFGWVQHILDTYNPTIGFYQAYVGPTGDYIMKYTMGWAIAYSPFFFLGHFAAMIFGFPLDGFSLPYQVSIALGGIVYAIIGIWFFRKILKSYFSEVVTSVVLVLFVLGTNYFQLTAYDGAMPHNLLFTLFAMIVWLTIRWHKEQRWVTAILLGLTVGLSTLIRPTSILIVLVPLLWNVHDGESLKAKGKLLFQAWKQLVVVVVLIGVVPFFQFLYWKIHAGTLFHYSYEADQKLQFLAPYLWFVLFSFKKGWLIYAPMMVFPLIGFYFLADRKREIFYGTFLFFLLNLFVIASWPTWWYGGSLGQRALMESYVLLGLPMGYFIEWLLQRKFWIKSVFYLLFSFFILLNLFQTWQYMNFIIDPAMMTRGYYFAIFGKTEVTDQDRMLVEGYKPDAGDFLRDKGKLNSVIGFWDFEANNFPYKANQVTTHVKNGRYAFLMNTGMAFSPGIKVTYGELTKKPQVGIRITAWVYSQMPFAQNPLNIVATSIHDGINYRYEALFVEQLNLAPRQWHPIKLDYLTPEYPDPNDFIQIYLWYRGTSEVYVDDLKIELFEPKD